MTGLGEAEDDRTRRPASPAHRRRTVPAVLALAAALAVALVVTRQPTSDRKEPPATSAPAALGPAVTVTSVPDAPGQVLVDISGAGPSRTRQVTPAGTWVLSWAYDCSLVAGAQPGFTVTVVGTGRTTVVNRLDAGGSGVERSLGAEPFHLEIDTGCAWTVKLSG